MRLLLIPSNENYKEKKRFSWSLVELSDSELTIQVDFKFPKYISAVRPDTLLVTFFNADKYLKPKSEHLGSIPDGFTLTIKLPPQGG